MKTRAQTKREIGIKRCGITTHKKELPRPVKLKSVKLVLERVDLDDFAQLIRKEPQSLIVHDPLNEKQRVKRIKMSEHLRQVERLKLDGNISENWRRFKRNFEIYLNASGIIGKGESTKINTFLNAIGEEAVEIFDTFTLTEEQKGSYTAVVKAFEDFCTPKKNTVYERFMFYQRKQSDGEPFDIFLMDIKRLVRSCEFGANENEMLRDQIVMGVNDKRLQIRLLEANNLTYDNTVEKCRASEATRE